MRICFLKLILSEQSMANLKEDILEHASATYQTVVDEIKSWIDLIREVWPLLILLLAGLGVMVWIAKPAPPDKVYMATGAGGSYKLLGEKYKAYFAKKNITLELVPTHGSFENLSRLKDRKDPVMAALVQGGMIAAVDTTGIASLGSIDYEPVWVFYRGPMLDEHVRLIDRDLSQFKVAIGPEGSGTHFQALNILKLNHQPTTSPNLFAFPNDQAVRALETGELDAVFLVDGFESLNVQKLIANPDIHVANFMRADAYTRLLPYFEKVSVPMGGFDLGQNIPPERLELLTTTTNLLIDDRLHPAVQLLFLEAAKEINGKKSYFVNAGDFPSYKNSEAPLSDEAKYFYQKGTPFLMKYLPFWLAEFVDRMFILLLPFGAFAYPILRAIPGYRINLARKNINKIYGQLGSFEQEILEAYDPRNKEQYLARLDDIERELLQTKAAKIATIDCYALRNNIEFIRGCIDKHAIYKSPVQDEAVINTLT
jgi:TRAP-type uncharacterized transport system substrate-binding protein